MLAALVLERAKALTLEEGIMSMAHNMTETSSLGPDLRHKHVGFCFVLFCLAYTVLKLAKVNVKSQKISQAFSF